MTTMTECGAQWHIVMQYMFALAKILLNNWLLALSNKLAIEGKLLAGCTQPNVHLDPTHGQLDGDPRCSKWGGLGKLGSLAALPLDLSGFIALRALTQTARRTTSPSSAGPFYINSYPGPKGTSTWEAETWFSGCCCCCWTPQSQRKRIPVTTPISQPLSDSWHMHPAEGHGLLYSNRTPC